MITIAAGAIAPAFADPSTARPPDALRFPDAELEPVGWSDLDSWLKDDQAAAFATFLSSCRVMVKRPESPREPPSMRLALERVCRQALRHPGLDADKARVFFEDSFRPLRISRLGEAQGLFTGYFEPVVDGSRFPTREFTVPIYRRPDDLVAPGRSTVNGFPNKGEVKRRLPDGSLVPYFDRGEIEDGALDGRHLEICWLRDPIAAFSIQIQGSARVRLEDGLILRIGYDGWNGHTYVPVGRILIERNIIPRDEMSLERIRRWMQDHPDEARELRRTNQSYVFFRITGLGDEGETIGGESVRLTPGRSIAVDVPRHTYGTPFYIEADLPLDSATAKIPFRRLMIAQDTGSAITGPARADIFFGAGDQAGRVAGRIRHSGRCIMLVPREIDPVRSGLKLPLPRARPTVVASAARTKPVSRQRTRHRHHR
ncbi:MAG TPA: MltA domain-containing protein [Xanthobacteraceae bacterium]|nr:MltA domain-containing protein [Xanthobacteraceae bacterium]